MYTKVENVRILLSLLKEHNIKHVVISPGGTNMPIVQGLQQDPFFKCYSVVDERSAMYFAIGLYLQLGETIATSCTSAQATRNYLPGLTEAFYKHVPILAITASKLPKYTYQELMQAPDQTSLPRDSVKKSYSLPYISNEKDRLMCVRIINEAILELTHHRPGPIQLNIPIDDSERLVFDSNSLPEIKAIRRYTLQDDWNFVLGNKKILVLIGESRTYSTEETRAIDSFVESYNAVVYTNHLSNYHGKRSCNSNLLLSAMSQKMFEEQYKPDVLITIGGQTGDYSVFGKLSSCPLGTFEHWRVSIDGDVVDVYDQLTKVFECDVLSFFNHFETKVCKNKSYYDLWNSSIKNLHYDVTIPFSNIFAAQQLYSLIPQNSNLSFAILNSLRSWLMFPLDSSIKCFSPVGAFGIDGGMSMAIGLSVQSQELNFFVTGDLAFFYDMNSLGIRGLKNNMRILLVNNHVGAEFTMYGRQDFDYERYISAAGHNGSAKGWAEANNFKYICASSKEEFYTIMSEFIQTADQSIVFEIFTTAENETIALKDFLASNTTSTGKEEIKNMVKSAIGVKGTELLMKFIKK